MTWTQQMATAPKDWVLKRIEMDWWLKVTSTTELPKGDGTLKNSTSETYCRYMER